MTRTLTTAVDGAVDLDVTRPIHLIRMGWETERRIATFDANITWNSETWTASGGEAQNISAQGGTLLLPVGTGLPWAGLCKDEKARGRSIVVYEYHTDFSVSPRISDADQIFSGTMDDASVTLDGIRISLREGRKHKKFPPDNIEPPTYNFLLADGQRLFWGPDIVNVST